MTGRKRKLETDQSQWSEVEVLIEKHEGFQSRLTNIYASGFPIEVRQWLADYIETVPWNEIPEDEQFSAQGIKYLQEIRSRVEIYARENLHDVASKQLCQHVLKKLSHFGTDPEDLIRVVRSCLKQERLLIDSLSNQGEYEDDGSVFEKLEHSSNVRLMEFKQIGDDIQRQHDKLMLDLQKIEIEIVTYAVDQDKGRKEVDSSNHRIEELKRLVEKKSPTVAAKSKLQKELSQKRKRNCEISNELNKLRNEIFQALKTVHEELEREISKFWEQINNFRDQQKKMITSLAMPPDGALACLNKMGQDIASILMTLVMNIDKAHGIFCALRFQPDTVREDLEKVRKSVDELLGKHVQRIIIIEHQPVNMIKISRGNSCKSFNTTLRILGGPALGLDVNLPTVNAKFLDEKNIESQATKIADLYYCSSKTPSSDIRMEFKKAQKVISVSLTNMNLRNFNPKDRLMVSERVTDYKYGILFTVKMKINEKDFIVQNLSLPMVITTQSSQNILAFGTIVWDAAFSPKDRTLFQHPNCVKWKYVRELLNAMFEKETGRGLDMDQWNYIGQRVFPDASNDLDNMIITKDKFIKENISDGTERNMDFSIWKWVYCCKNLVSSPLLIKEWRSGLIHGFVSREKCEEMLADKPIGTFLLRFASNAIDRSQGANVCGLLIPVAKVPNKAGSSKLSHMKPPLNHKQLQDVPLAHFLNNVVIPDPNTNTQIKVFRFLHPDRPIEEAFHDFLPRALGDEFYDVMHSFFVLNISDSVPNTPAPSTPAPSTPSSVICQDQETVMLELTDSSDLKKELSLSSITNEVPGQSSLLKTGPQEETKDDKVSSSHSTDTLISQEWTDDQMAPPSNDLQPWQISDMSGFESLHKTWDNKDTDNFMTGSQTMQHQLIPQNVMSPQKQFMPSSPLFTSPNSRDPMSPNQQIFRSPQNVLSPTQHAVSPQLVLSPQQHVMSAQHVMPPQQHIMSPQQHVMLPQQHVMSSQQHVMSHQQHVMSPQQHDVSHQQQGLLSNSHMMKSMQQMEKKTPDSTTSPQHNFIQSNASSLFSMGDQHYALAQHQKSAMLPKHTFGSQEPVLSPHHATTYNPSLTQDIYPPSASHLLPQADSFMNELKSMTGAPPDSSVQNKDLQITPQISSILLDLRSSLNSRESVEKKQTSLNSLLGSLQSAITDQYPDVNRYPTDAGTPLRAGHGADRRVMGTPSSVEPTSTDAYSSSTQELAASSEEIQRMAMSSPIVNSKTNFTSNCTAQSPLSPNLSTEFQGSPPDISKIEG